jgi:hypothetical protein
MAILMLNQAISNRTTTMHIHRHHHRADSTHLSRTSNLRVLGLHISKQLLVHRVAPVRLHHPMCRR